jgi:hypothetical protein
MDQDFEMQIDFDASRSTSEAFRQVCYWSSTEHILVAWLPTGQAQSIFLLAGSQLVKNKSYSRCLAFDWSSTEHCLVVWLPIGQAQSIFVLAGF